MTTVERTLLVMYVFTVFVFGVLAVRADVNTRQIETNAYDSCVTRVTNVERTNAQNRALIEIEQENPYRFTSPQTIADRIAIYERGILTVPDCSKIKPR